MGSRAAQRAESAGPHQAPSGRPRPGPPRTFLVQLCPLLRSPPALAPAILRASLSTQKARETQAAPGSKDSSCTRLLEEGLHHQKVVRRHTRCPCALFLLRGNQHTVGLPAGVLPVCPAPTTGRPSSDGGLSKALMSPWVRVHRALSPRPGGGPAQLPSVLVGSEPTGKGALHPRKRISLRPVPSCPSRLLPSRVQWHWLYSGLSFEQGVPVSTCCQFNRGTCSPHTHTHTPRRTHTSDSLNENIHLCYITQ